MFILYHEVLIVRILSLKGSGLNVKMKERSKRIKKVTMSPPQKAGQKKGKATSSVLTKRSHNQKITEYRILCHTMSLYTKHIQVSLFFL